MKNAIFLLFIIVFGVTHAPIQALAISPSQSNTQGNIPTVPSSPIMREGTRVTPPSP
jgi:hypothetical protein